MSRLNRRQFLNRSMVAAGIGAGFAIGGTKSSGRVIGANDTIRVGVAGLNGRGGSHVERVQQDERGRDHLPDRPRHHDLREADQADRQERRQHPEDSQGHPPALDDKNLDAISIATPNHWHSLITIWGCQAGKDVYVEKPCSHNVHEGRIAVEAARKYDRIVQHGTQSRQLGDVGQGGRGRQVGPATASCSSRAAFATSPAEHRRQAEHRGPREPRLQPLARPGAEQPFNANYVHYNWHWFWDFGNGDIGNQGVHQMDMARWMIPGATLPKSVVSLGGRFGYNDQGETPNTQIALGLRRHATDLRGPRPQDRLLSTARRSATSLHLEEGTIVGREPSSIPRGRRRRAANRCPRSRPSEGRARAALRQLHRRRPQPQDLDLNADILEGHYSSRLCHLANISYRLGEQVPFNPRPRPSATTRMPTRPSSAWRSISRRTTA